MKLFRLFGAIPLAFGLTLSSLHGASFVAEVLQYEPGTGVGSYTNTSTVIGAPGPIVSEGTQYEAVLTPFNPHFEDTKLVSIGAGGSITLRLENYVLIDRTGRPEIGVWENVGFIADLSGGTDDGPSAFGADSAVVEVSPDNVHWYALNSGEPIVFGLPGNYFANADGPFAGVPAQPVYADFGKPFTGQLQDFKSKSFAEVLAVLDGSAGGTWLDLDSVPLEVTQIGFIRFSGVAVGATFDLDAVSINNALVGAPTPEPNTALLFAGSLAFAGFVRHRRA